MTAAKELLAGSDISAAEVASLVGFKRHASFSAAFRESCGVTPSEYRDAERSGCLSVKMGDAG
jgi:AraC-like DNA-binding protein